MKIDLLDPASFIGGHPHGQYDWLREHEPVHWHPAGDGGFWAVTRYDDVHAIGRNAETYSNSPSIMIQDHIPELSGAESEYKMLLQMDPPEHTAYRKLISREFTQGPARAYLGRIEALARQIVDAVIDQGGCDFVTDIAGEMPSFVVADLMGLPLEDGRELYKLTEVIHTAPEAAAPGAATEAVMKMFAYAQEVIAQKRRKPADDLASKLLAAEVDGRRLADEEFQLFFMLLVDAGGDTTRNLVATGMYELLRHPDQLQALLADLDARLPAARDELLRYTTPVIYMRRTATQAAELGSKQVRAGDKVVMYYGAANRDPAHFAEPHQLDLARTPNKHLAFGGGHHVCLGQWFARLEADAILKEVLTRLTDIEITGETEWLPSNFISGLTAMPVTFRPA